MDLADLLRTVLFVLASVAIAYLFWGLVGGIATGLRRGWYLWLAALAERRDEPNYARFLRSQAERRK